MILIVIPIKRNREWQKELGALVTVTFTAETLHTISAARC